MMTFSGLTRVLLALTTLAALAAPALADASTAPAAATAPAEVTTSAGHDDAHHAAPETSHAATGHAVAHFLPPAWAAAPFIIILLAIALLPLIHKTSHWWEHNHNKLIVSAVLAGITITYYLVRGAGFPHGQHATDPGIAAVKAMLSHAVLGDYIPFMVLLFSLYTICGGLVLRGDLRATPTTNTTFLAMGALFASFVGTTGASMLLIRPLLQTNRERKIKVHTIIFFIFLVSNIGGTLLPIGDPPLFLGYLRGVPFFWTIHLAKEWLFCTVLLLVIYYVWDTFAYRREGALEKMLDRELIEPLRVNGSLNLLWLLGIVAAVAFIRPGKPLLGIFAETPEYVREGVMLALVAIAWVTTAAQNRERNQFNFTAITEVAVLFIGIFITMQVPIEILKIKGPQLGLSEPYQFFWAAGTLSSFLDNAPTYAVFFETANTLTHQAGPGILKLVTGEFIREDLLAAISLGAVFMGANTYIGNGPNFMVKSIAEQSGVKMPSFFGYMLYSVCILIPVFFAVMFLFL